MADPLEMNIAWGDEISTDEVVQKEKLVQEILTMQDGLRALLERNASVAAECEKAAAENETLQTYIDSVTKSLAAKS